MSHAALSDLISSAFKDRANINASTQGDIRDAVNTALNMLDRGEVRIAEKIPEAMGPLSWRVNTWLKQAVMLSFRLNDNQVIQGGPSGVTWWDKMPLKCAGWGEKEFAAAGFRSVPGAIVRHSAYIAPDAVLMPCFVNVGAYVGTKTMVDTFATVGSCAQIGNNVHLSGGVGIGGMLEPLQSQPTVIEDDCFIGARSEIVEGAIVGQGAVLSMGVYLSSSTPVVNRKTALIYYGYVPAYSVVIPGTLPGKNLLDGTPGPSLYCAVIVKTVDAKTRAKTEINQLLRF